MIYCLYSTQYDGIEIVGVYRKVDSAYLFLDEGEWIKLAEHHIFDFHLSEFSFFDMQELFEYFENNEHLLGRGTKDFLSRLI